MLGQYLRAVQGNSNASMAPSRPLQVRAAVPAQPTAMPRPGVVLQDLTWIEAQSLLTETTVVVIPLGGLAKEHGPHLKLDNDWRLAQYLARRVAASSEVVVAPTVGYHYYPAFIEYPGS